MVDRRRRHERITLQRLVLVSLGLCVGLGLVALSPSASASASAAPAAPPTPAPSAATSAFVAVGPLRLADTRRTAGYTTVGPGTIRVAVIGQPGVPDAAVAATVTLTMTAPAAAGYLTAYPAGTARPIVSNLNVNGPGETVANSATVALAGGAIDIYSPVTAGIVVDLTGVFVPAPGQVAAGRLVLAPTPTRVVDTRKPDDHVHAGVMRAGEVVRIPLPAGAPADATALVVNLTATAPSRAGYWTAYPAGAPRPASSNLNTTDPDQTQAALAIVPVSAAGIDIAGSGGGNLVVDVLGWFTGPSAAPSSDGLFVPSAPERVLDTRPSLDPIFPGGTIEIATPPPTGVPTVSAVLLNLTTTASSVPSYLSVHPAGTARPSTSNVNAAVAGESVANEVIAAVSDRGVAITSNGGEDALVDRAGWFTGPTPPAGSVAAVNVQPVSYTARRSFGSSVAGRDLVAYHRVGSSAPTRRVLVVGTVHGEEPAGVQVADALRTAALPADLDLWLVPTGNPDGLAVGRRTNDHGVDLNRNFPQNWAPNGTPTDVSSHYSGPSAGSEPETKAMMAFLSAVHPDTTVWYHQPLETIDCNLARDAALATRCTRYAAAVGLPVNTPADRPPGFMVFSGTATDWQMSHGLGEAFVVEFSVGIGPITVARHVAAVITTLV